MTTEPVSTELDNPPRGRSAARYRSHPGLVGLVIAAVLGAGGLWWHLNRPEACYRRGRQALRAGDRQTVLEEARRLLRSPGFESQGRLLRGLLFAQDGQAVEALQELEPAARNEATAVEALTVAAECCSVLGRYIEAIDTANAALARDADALDARRWLAVAYYDLGAAANAAQELKRISAKAPNDPRPERLLGLIARDNEQFIEAIEHYRESLRRNPDHADRAVVVVEMAEALARLGRFDEALKTLHDSDRTARMLTLEAECEHGLGRLEIAESRLREALELDPRYFPALLEKGTLLLARGRPVEASAVLEEAVRLEPLNRQGRFQLSQAYGRQGQRDKGAEQLKLMQEAQSLEREFSELNNLASQRPADADVRYRAGILADKFGKADLARMWYRSTIAINPHHAGALAALAEADGPQNRP